MRGFVITLVFVIILNLLSGNLFNLSNQNVVKAAASSVTWSSTGDFSNNDVSGKGPTSVSNVNAANNQVSLSGQVHYFTGISKVANALSEPSYVIKGDGFVWSWGRASYGQLGDGSGSTVFARETPVQVKDTTGTGYLSSVLSVSGGGNHTLAVKNDGSVFAWGNNEYGQVGDNSTDIEKYIAVQVKDPAGTGYLTAITAVSGGGYHSLALKSDGTVWAWGLNTSGQLGDNTTINKRLPVQVKDTAGTGYLTGIIAISTGSFYSLALKNDGTVWAWGKNDYGQLGDNTIIQKNTPVQVKDTAGTGYLTGIIAISTGSLHSLALKNDGTVWAWGYNFSGMLGDDTTVQKNTPVQVKDATGAGFLTEVTAIRCGSSHSLALKSDGTVWAWGNNSGGQLGNNTTTQSKIPVQVKDTTGDGYLIGVTAIGGGLAHNLALKNDNTIWSWGGNTYGQLGIGNKTNSWLPKQVIYKTFTSSILPEVSAVSSSSNAYHTLALKNDGTVWAWGMNDQGRLGDNTTITRYWPVQVKDQAGTGYLDNIIAVATGASHSLALKNDGTVWAWGRNTSGTLGDNTTISKSIPVQVKDSTGSGYLTGIIAITAGSSSYALKNDGTVWSWGTNTYGALGDNTTTQRNVPVQVRDNAGTGYLTGITKISAGSNHCLALKDDGTVWAWGYNSNGQIGENSITHRYKPYQVKDTAGTGYLTGINLISAGGRHSVAIKDDGTVWAWGLNVYGQLGDNSTTDRWKPIQVKNSTGAGWLSNMISIAAGDSHTLAVKNDGTVWAFGRNSQGELGQNVTDANSHSLPLQVKDNVGTGSLVGIISVKAGLYFSIAVQDNGTVWIWGYNVYGQLGDDTGATQDTPTNPVIISEIVHYLTSGTINNLKYQANSKVFWSNILWDGTSPTNTTIKFRTRSANTEADLALATWSPYYTSSGDSIASNPSNWLEVELTLESIDEVATPTLFDFTIAYNTLDAPALENMSISSSIGAFSTGGNEEKWTKDTTINFDVPREYLTCSGCGISNDRRAQIEVISTNLSFNDSGTVGTEYVEDGGVGDGDGVINGAIVRSNETTVASTAFTVGSGYHWRARSIDDEDRISPWTVYGTGSDVAPAVADFSIEQTPPTGSILLDNGADTTLMSTVDLTINALDEQSGVQFVAFSNNGTDFSSWDSYADIYSNGKTWTLGGSSGVQKVWARFMDNAGNISTAEYSDVITVETPVDPPPVFIDLPGQIEQINLLNDQVITTNPYIIKVKPIDNSSVSRVEFYVDSVLICTETNADAEGIYSCSWDTSKYHSEIQVYAYDDANNRSELLARSVTVNLDRSGNPFGITELTKTGVSYFDILFNLFLSFILCLVLNISYKFYKRRKKFFRY